MKYKDECNLIKDGCRLQCILESEFLVDLAGKIYKNDFADKIFQYFNSNLNSEEDRVNCLFENTMDCVTALDVFKCLHNVAFKREIPDDVSVHYLPVNSLMSKLI